MAMAYVPPGVLPIREIQNSPIATPGNVAAQIVPIIIGESIGYQTSSENRTLSGTAEIELGQKGSIINDSTLMNLSFTVVNPSTYETVGPANFLMGTAAGTATGDHTTTFRAIAYPGTVTATGAGTGTAAPISVGEYRYAVSYVIDINTGAGTTTYESGIGSATGTVSIGTAQTAVTISNVAVGDSFINSNNRSVVGRNIYRSTNIGTQLNPIWSPYYRLPGTATGVPTINNGTATTYSDTTTDPTGNDQPVPGLLNVTSVNIQYDYADTEYWKPTIFSDFNDIVDKYGEAFTETGEINSKLSFAAKLSILNGASAIVGVPVPPNATQQDWEDALIYLDDDEDGQILVPITGDSTIFGLVQAKIAAWKQKNLYKTAILGMDGSSTAVTKETLRGEASALGGDSSTKGDICLVSPAVFSYYNSFTNTDVMIGGQYAAAAIAGMHAGRSVADSMTRKQVAGLSAVKDNRTTIDKNQDAASGLLVVEQITSTGSIRVRHEITTSPEDINKREFSVALQRNNMIKRVVDEIDQSIIGQIYADTAAPGRVADVVSQILRGLVNAGQLTDFSGLAAKISASDPTIVEVRWQYKPVYTVQYVQITLGINLSTGGVTTGGGINLIL